jgi:hypothetical protein
LDEEFLRTIFYPLSGICGQYNKFKRNIKNCKINNYFRNLRAVIYYDHTDDTHQTGSNVNGKNITFIYINGSDGEKILDDLNDYTVDFNIKQRYNNSAISYNVIGQVDGTNTKNETVILCCLYDSAQCQGTGDSAIGMAIVLGVAKYFVENDIEPYYNLKFIGFSGEEAGCRGARYYEAAHYQENIKYVIDMNQVGLLQESPKLTLNVIGNNLFFINRVWEVVKRSDYEKRVNYSSFIAKRYYLRGAPSDAIVFNLRCPCVCFLEDFPWIMHHKDGLNHEKGDTMDQFEWIDVSVTGEIVLNVTIDLACKSNEQISNNTLFNNLFQRNTYLNRFFRKK